MTAFLRNAALAVAAMLGAAAAPAAITINIYQSGADVIAAGAGSLDVTGLTLVNANGSGLSSLISGTAAATRIGSGNTAVYSGVSGAASFGTNGSVLASSSTGGKVGVIGSSGYLFLPANYVSGNLVSGSSTFANTTLGALGLTNGNYVYLTPHDSLTVSIGTAPAVPEAASWAMMLVGFGAIGALARRQRRTVTLA